MDWLEYFLIGQLYINCETILEAKILLDILENSGVVWYDESKPLENLRWHRYRECTAYGVGFSGKLTTGGFTTCILPKTKKFSDIIKEGYNV